MFSKPNLGGNSIFSLPQSTRPRRTPSHYAYSGDFIGDREFDSNVSYFLILIKACLVFVCTPINDEWEDVYAPFRPKLESWPTKLWMTYWFVPLALGSLPTVRVILDPTNKRVPFYLLFVQPYILCSPNSKGQIKDVKIWGWPKSFGIP